MLDKPTRINPQFVKMKIDTSVVVEQEAVTEILFKVSALLIFLV
jgi:hypothetical protein